jgi:oligoribonuclease
MKLYWVDLETTALRPEDGSILEVAVGVSDAEVPWVLEGTVQSWVVHYQSACSLDSAIRDMHTNNGLWDECKRSAFTVTDAEEYLCEVWPASSIMLAGFSPHFDQRWVWYHMPLLGKRLSHQVFDVTTIKSLCMERYGMPRIEKCSVHRAASDVEEATRHLKKCLDWIERR